ncbi:hypothetical protein C8R47DRAFT_1134269 [Mycena vitilis]|nr:hypothetical protein C8R47DRAFT_1134269 [Mycena vitilis]
MSHSIAAPKGTSLRIDVHGVGVLKFIVADSFTPCTMSQVYLAHSPADIIPHLPPLIILKVFDPKVFAHRNRSRHRSGNPWSLDAETEAASLRGSLGPNPSWTPADLPDEGDLVGWEEYYFQKSQAIFSAELKAYARLISLQGKTIPRCFGYGHWAAEGRRISPPVLLLEYIPNATSLAHNIEPSTIPDSALGDSLLKAAERFGYLGVVHTDLNPGNILIARDSAGCPTRAVIIDFGESGVRQSEVTDAVWTEIVRQNNDPRWLGMLLKKKQIPWKYSARLYPDTSI